VVTTITNTLSGDQPQQLVFDGMSGFLFVMNGNSRTVKKVTVPGGIVTTISGGTYGSADANGASAQYITPYGIAMAGAYLYISDYGGDNIRMLTKSGSFPTVTLAGKQSLGSIDVFLLF
jgi:hypothetical protein